jgi:hypothetical protein
MSEILHREEIEKNEVNIINKNKLDIKNGSISLKLKDEEISNKKNNQISNIDIITVIKKEFKDEIENENQNENKNENFDNNKNNSEINVNLKINNIHVTNLPYRIISI